MLFSLAFCNKSPTCLLKFIIAIGVIANHSISLLLVKASYASQLRKDKQCVNAALNVFKQNILISKCAQYEQYQ